MFRPENIRLRTMAGDGVDGYYEIPHYKITDYVFFVVASSGIGWEHVSVSLLKKRVTVDKVHATKVRNHKPGNVLQHRTLKTVKDTVERCPTWEEMCFIKDFFWTKDEVVVQFHPAESDYVSLHPYCLHLWKPTGEKLLVPDPSLIGPVGANIQSF